MRILILKYKILGIILSFALAACGGDNLHSDDDPFTGHWLSSCVPFEVLGGSVSSGLGYYFVHELKLTAETVNDAVKFYEDSACEEFLYGDALALSGKSITDIEVLMSENGYVYNKYTYINSEGNPVSLGVSYTGDVLYGVSADIDHLMNTGEKQYNLIFD